MSSYGPIQCFSFFSLVVAAVVVSFFFQLPYAERLLSGRGGNGSQLGDDILELNEKISHCNTRIRPLCSLDSNPPPPSPLSYSRFLIVLLRSCFLIGFVIYFGYGIRHSREGSTKQDSNDNDFILQGTPDIGQDVKTVQPTNTPEDKKPLLSGSEVQ